MSTAKLVLNVVVRTFIGSGFIIIKTDINGERTEIDWASNLQTPDVKRIIDGVLKTADLKPN